MTMNFDKFHLRSENEIGIEEIKEAFDAEFIPGKEKVFKGIALDSRNVCTSDLFFALKGETTDAHKYIKKALENKASGIVLEYFPPNVDISAYKNVWFFKVNNTLEALHKIAKYNIERYPLKKIKLSGSIGKTTARKMAVSIFENKARVLTNYKNYNNFTGLPLTLLKANRSYGYGIFEIGINQPDEMEKLTKLIKTDLVALLNIRPVHTEFFSSIKELGREKLNILKDGDNIKTLIINNDDKFLSDAADELNVSVFRYGIEKKSDLYAKNLAFLEKGYEFTLVTPDYKIAVSLPILGKHNIYNALAAASMAYLHGIDLNIIKEGLEDFVPEDMRCNLIILKNNVKIINDCYNAGPDSTRAALEILKNMSDCNKKIAVLGDMLELGKDEKKYHFDIGKIVADLNIDYLLSYGKAAEYFTKGALENGMKKSNAIDYRYKAELFGALMNILEDGDCLLVKGSRGMKMEEITEMLLEKFEVVNDR